MSSSVLKSLDGDMEKNKKTASFCRCGKIDSVITRKRKLKAEYEDLVHYTLHCLYRVRVKVVLL